jgi:FG-GAP repeat
MKVQFTSNRSVRAGGFCVLSVLVFLSGCNGSIANNNGSQPSATVVTYTVATSTGTGGNVSPASATVAAGASTSFTVTADTGYMVDTVSGCGGALADTTYTTGAVTGNCTVTASFVPSYTITTSVGAGGSISPTSTTVPDGTAVSFTVTPDGGYLPSVSGCGGTLAGSTYTTSAGTEDCTVTASFAQVQLTLTPQAIKTFHFSWPAVTGATGYRLLEDPDSVSGYTQIATPGGSDTSYDLDVSLPGRINARYVLEACNSQGCADSVAVAVSSSLAEAAGYVKASNTAASDSFAWSVALSGDGNTLAVGAYQEDSNATGIDGNQADNSASAAGAVYVYTRSGNTWSQQAYVKASNTQTADEFGYAVSLSSDGNTLAVTAVYEDSAATGIDGNQADNNASVSGATYVFTRSGSTWSQQAYVKASNTESADLFGTSVALSGDGNTLAVGAKWEDSAATGIDGNQADNSVSASGAVYLYTRSGSTWSQQAYVKASNPDANDEFGSVVALSSDGNTLAVGAKDEDSNATGINGNEADNSLPGSGAVYVFTRGGSTWSQQAYVKASNPGTYSGTAGDYFGGAVALSADGNTMAVGAFYESSAATGIDGNQSDNSAAASGAAYVFTRSSGTWTQQAYVKASNTQLVDQFGQAIALSSDGNTLAVGASREASAATGIDGNQADNTASNSGAVYVFTRSGSTWSQRAYVKSPNTDMGDTFGGYGLGLSSDGNTLAVGAWQEDSAATGVGGDQSDNSASGSGAVYLY